MSLTLNPDTDGGDFTALLRQKSSSGNRFQHVRIKVPQEHVLEDLMYQYGDDRKVLKMDSDALLEFLSSPACCDLETFALKWDDCIYDFTKKATDGGRALAPLGNLTKLKKIRMYFPMVDSVDILYSFCPAATLQELTLNRLAIALL